MVRDVRSGGQSVNHGMFSTTSRGECHKFCFSSASCQPYYKFWTGLYLRLDSSTLSSVMFVSLDLKCDRYFESLWLGGAEIFLGVPFHCNLIPACARS